MTTIAANDTLIKMAENVINWQIIHVIAFHYNNGVLVGITAYCDGQLMQFYYEDVETIIENYKKGI